MRRRIQVARVSLIRVNVNFEHDLGVVAHLDAVEGEAAGAVDSELEVAAIFHAVVGHVRFAHVGWRSARMTPLLIVIAPFGPMIVQPGVFSWLPLMRSGRSMPR